MNDPVTIVRSTLDSVSEGVVVVDATGRWLLFNSAAADLLGAGPTDTPLSDWPATYGIHLPDGVTLCPPDRLPLLRAERGETCETLDLFIRNARRPDGVHVSVAARPLLGHAGTCLLVFRDITQRRLAERAATESRDLLELFFSQSLDGFFFMMLDEPIRWDDAAEKDALLDWVFDHQRITKVNEAMLAQYGASRDQLLGLTPRDFYAHDLTTGKKIWRAFFDSGRLHVETDERRIDGTPMRIEGDYICVHDAEGRITGHFGIQRDVTERQRAAEALRRSEEKFEKAFRSSPFRVSISTLREGRFIEVNDSFLRDLGLTREDVIGRTSAELDFWAHPEQRARLVQILQQDGSVRDFEFEGRNRDGRREITLLSGEVIDIGGEPCLLAVVYDITERKRAEAEIHRSRAELRALAARLQSIREQEQRRIAREIHDELGQALTGLKMDLAWLADRLGRRRFELAEWTSGMAGRLDETLARVRRIATELHPSVLDHLGLVAAVEWQAGEFESRTGIPVRLDLPSDLPAVDGDRATTVFRILQEALTNVARHSKATEVVVRLRVDGELALEVRDNGVGLPPARPPAELSLGLVGMRERAIACGGEVQIRTARGEGTSVVARIPLDPEAGADPEREEPRRSGGAADPSINTAPAWGDPHERIERSSAIRASARTILAPTARPS